MPKTPHLWAPGCLPLRSGAAPRGSARGLSRVAWRAGWAGSADSPGCEPRRLAPALSVSSAAGGESTGSRASAGGHRRRRRRRQRRRGHSQGAADLPLAHRALGGPRRITMLPSLALLLLAAWTVRALEVGAAPWERHGGGGLRGGRDPTPPRCLNLEARRGTVAGIPLLAAPACGLPALRRLRPNPARGRAARPMKRERVKALGSPDPCQPGAGGRGGEPERRP